MRKLNQYRTNYLLCFVLMGLFSLQSLTINAQSQSAIQEILTGADMDLRCNNDFGLCFGGVTSAIINGDDAVTVALSGDRVPSVPLLEGDRLGLGDFTQTVMAALTFKLMEQGDLMLSDPISDYISTGSLTNVSGSITIEQLLRHTSGLDEFSTDDDYFSTILFTPNQVWTAEMVTESFVGGASSPGSFSYANTNYLILGLVLDAANGGASLQESIDDLLAGAGLSGIEIFPNGDTDPEDFGGLFEDLFGTGIPNQITPNTSICSSAGGSGSLIGTGSSMVQFMAALAKGEIITPSSVEQMTTFSNISGRLSDRYGFGIEEFTVNVDGDNRTMIGHYGEVNFTSLVLYDPATDCGVALSTSNGFADPQTLLDVAAEYFAECEVVGINPQIIAESFIQVYPNPASDNLFVNYELLQPATIQMSIQNMNGQTIWAGTATEEFAGNQTATVNIKSLAAGVYHLNIMVNGEMTTERFIVK